MMYRIIAPVCSVGEIEPVLRAGAKEVYFGMMPEKWVRKYGNADFISRRQGEITHISCYDELSEIADIVNQYDCSATLVLNSRYSEEQLPFVFEILEKWENAGGNSVMTSDIEILLWLNSKRSRLKRQLSIMAGIFNTQGVEFYKQLNVSRIVLPREMAISELSAIKTVKMEYEMIVMFQKCEFIDSFCGFYHSFNYQPYIVHDYAGPDLPIIKSYDPCYEGHGCQMQLMCSNKNIKHVNNDDMNAPFCAACSMEYMLNAGINNFKIAGRGYPFEMIIKAITFIEQTLQNHKNKPADIMHSYIQTFGQNCCQSKCYYK
jgi:Collagenase and related proteases